MILIAYVLEKVQQKGDTQFLKYLVSLMRFLPFSATALLDVSPSHVYEKWEVTEGVAKAAICPTTPLVPFLYENTSAT